MKFIPHLVLPLHVARGIPGFTILPLITEQQNLAIRLLVTACKI